MLRISYLMILVCVLLGLAASDSGCASKHTTGSLAATPDAPLVQDVSNETKWPPKESLPTDLKVHFMGEEEAANAPKGLITVTAEEAAITDKATFIKVFAMHPFDGFTHDGWTDVEIQMLHEALIRNGHAVLCCDPDEDGHE